MSTGFAIELSDLRGWSSQVTRAAGHCEDLAAYVANNVTDGDFGMILDLITGPYESMIPVFTQALSLTARDWPRPGSR